MKKSSSVKTKSIIIFAVAGTLFISLNSETRAEELRRAEILTNSQKFILLILDDQSFFCPLCREIFLNFCEALHASGHDEFTLGLLVPQVSDDDEDKERTEKIIEKQMKGLIVGCNIRIPFLYDRSHIFKGMELDGATVILFDRVRNLLKKYTLPLTPGQKEEFFSF